MYQGSDHSLLWTPYQKEKLPSHYTMPWVVRCNSRLLFGPFPVTLSDIWYLLERLQVTHIVNLCIETGKVNAKTGFPSAEFYKCHFPKDFSHDCVVRIPFDYASIEPKGRLKAEQDVYLAREYVKIAKRIYTHVLKEDAARIVYIHQKDGDLPETYIAMAVWALMADAVSALPTDPVAWLPNGRLLGGGNEVNKAFLRIVWKVAIEHRTVVKGTFFGAVGGAVSADAGCAGAVSAGVGCADAVSAGDIKYKKLASAQPASAQPASAPAPKAPLAQPSSSKRKITESKLTQEKKRNFFTVQKK